MYQIDLLHQIPFRPGGRSLSLYKELLRRQPVPYPAYIDAGDMKILSLSPERFIKKKGSFILTEPMKGTWPRGSNVFLDAIERRRFAGIRRTGRRTS